jgi:cysteine desulfurase / selenocysteine lyase
MAVTAEPKLDAHKLRADFPILEQEIHGKPLAYLDSAVSAQKPRQVLDAVRDFY